MDARNRRWLAVTLGLLAAALAGAGCSNFMDDVTRRDFSFQRFYNRPNPLQVLQNSHSADDRAQAMRALKEPLQNGGDARDQAVVMTVLTTAARSDAQVVCRMAAISSLGRFKDPAAVEALKDAYYRAGDFNPETATILRCQALEALGTSRGPTAVELLVKVIKEPPVEGAAEDKQAKMDERIAAARALGNFKLLDAASALADVLRTDQDVALRNRATEGLAAITGKDLPADYTAWADFLNKPEGRDAVVKENKEGGNWINLVGWWK